MATNMTATCSAAVVVGVLAAGLAAPPGAGAAAAAAAGDAGSYPEALTKDLPRGQVRVDALDDELIMHT